MDLTIYIQKPSLYVPFWEDAPEYADLSTAFLNYHIQGWGNKFVPKQLDPNDDTIAIYKFVDVNPEDVVKFYNDLVDSSHPLHPSYFSLHRYVWSNEFITWFDRPDIWNQYTSTAAFDWAQFY